MSWFRFTHRNKRLLLFTFFQSFLLFFGIAIFITLFGILAQHQWEFAYLESKEFSTQAFIVSMIFVIIFVCILIFKGDDDSGVKYWYSLIVLCVFAGLFFRNTFFMVS